MKSEILRELDDLCPSGPSDVAQSATWLLASGWADFVSNPVQNYGKLIIIKTSETIWFYY